MRTAALTLLIALGATTALAQPARQWIFNSADEVVTLTYGTPESDDVVIAFTCEPAEKQLRISEFFATHGLTVGKEAKLTLSSGAQRLTYPGKAIKNEMDDTVNVEVLRAPDPALFALLKAGQPITIDADGRPQQVPSAAAHAQAFEKACLAK